jgi:hypothetical protein
LVIDWRNRGWAQAHDLSLRDALPAQITALGKRHNAAHDIAVVSDGPLPMARNLHEANAGPASMIVRAADRPEAEALFLSGAGMPVLAALKDDLRTPPRVGP